MRLTDYKALPSNVYGTLIDRESGMISGVAGSDILAVAGNPDMMD